jgi:formylglycine-generating enzyme required for sulfatase activity
MKSPETRKPRPASKPDSDAPSFDQREQSVQQQFNAQNLHLHHPAPPTPSELPPFPRTASERLAAIEREFALSLKDLRAHYILPDLQDFNPPDELNSPSLIVSRQPAFQVFDAFVARPNLSETGQRCLFILGDAGMGKTSLLLMLAFRHLREHLPAGQDCVLLKLGPETLARLDQIPEPGRTVLLLDSLDEDPAAHDHAQGAEGRLLEILPRLAPFYRVVLTCRSQFFPETSPHLTTLAGHFVVGSFECPLKYLALFNDTQVEAYLRQKYDRSQILRLVRALTGGEVPKLAQAREAAQAMESLRLRPLLLSRIDDFVNDDDRRCVDFHNSYAVYHRLVDQWLMRDAQKHAGLSAAESWRVAVLLALHLTRLGVRKLGRDALAQVPGLEEIPRFKLEARSLLNRNKDREYQFAHNTIQEFLFAHAILAPALATQSRGDESLSVPALAGSAGDRLKPGLQTTNFDVAGLTLSRETWRFVQHGQKFLGLAALDLRGARIGFLEPLIGFALTRYGIELLPIAPGEFLMGSPENEPGRSGDETQHQVRLTQPFWMGRYPVTQAEFEAVMGENPSHFKGARRPVENVDWHQAMAFCAKLTERAREAGCLPEGFVFRLPTEAEWEYACRAGTTSAFNDGSACTQPEGKDPALDRLGWVNKNSGKETHPVGEKLPNAWGLHDLHGNVWEWCLDGKRDYTAEAQTDPFGPVEEGAFRVVRGGSWYSRARDCRAAIRFRSHPEYRDGLLGLRLSAGQEPGRGAPSGGRRGAPVPEAPAARPASRASRPVPKTEI